MPAVESLFASGGGVVKRSLDKVIYTRCALIKDRLSFQIFGNYYSI